MAKRYGRKRTSKRRPTGNRKRRGRKGRRGKKMSAGKRATMAIINTIVKATEPYNFITNWAYRIGGTNGTMLYSLLCQYYDAYDIATMHNTLQPIVGNTITPLNRFVVGRFSGRYCIKSMNNLDTWMTIYKCVPRRDVSIQEIPLTNLTTATPIQVYDPFVIMQKGWYESTTPPTSSSIDQTTWPAGLTPYMIPAFTSMFKIIKTKRLKITGGGYKFLNVKAKPWHLFNGEWITGCNPTDRGPARNVCMLKGRTVTYFALTKGQPIVDAGTYYKTSIGGADFAISCEETYQYTGDTFTQRRIQRINNLYDTVTTLSTINEQTEVKSGYVFA